MTFYLPRQNLQKSHSQFVIKWRIDEKNKEKRYKILEQGDKGDEEEETIASHRVCK